MKVRRMFLCIPREKCNDTLLEWIDTRIVMLPHEAHTYRARESVGHVLAEMVNWFENHVKGDSEGVAGGP